MKFTDLIARHLLAAAASMGSAPYYHPNDNNTPRQPDRDWETDQ